MLSLKLVTPEKMRDRVEYRYGERIYMVPRFFQSSASCTVDAAYNTNPYFIALYTAICSGSAANDVIERLSVDFEQNVRSYPIALLEDFQFQQRIQGIAPS